jgi:hypothetical protein
MKKMVNAQIKIVSESKQTVQETLDILKAVFPMHVESKIMPNDRDEGYHCMMTINPGTNHY